MQTYLKLAKPTQKSFISQHAMNPVKRTRRLNIYALPKSRKKGREGYYIVT